jgi:putative flippase GtrA
MKKTDVIYPLIIGELIALIFLGISSSLDLPKAILGVAKFFPVILPILSVIGVFIAQFIGKKFPALFQLAKFVLVGALNTFIYLGVLNLLMALFGISRENLSYPVFVAVSFCFSVVNSYFWNKFWTYEKKDTGVRGLEFGKFFVITGIGFFLNTGIASLIFNAVGPQFGLALNVWANVAAIAATICVFMWNFLGYKFIVFKK